MDQLTFSLFGSLQLQTATLSTQLTLAPKTQALLAFLIIEHDRAHGREWMAAFLWPDSSEAGGRNNLRQSLFVLRQSLGRHADLLLQITPRALQWNHKATGVVVDVLRFEHLLAEAGKQNSANHLRALEQAVALYRSPFLYGMSESGSDRFDEWLAIQRAQLEQKVMAALLRLSEHAAKQGDLASAQRFAHRQIEIGPLSEPAYRQLMQVLAKAGDSTAALSHYETLIDLLQRELDVTPMPETTALAEKIRGGRHRAVSKTVRQWDSGTVAVNDESIRNLQSPISNLQSAIRNPHLPLPLMPLIGRQSEVESIVQQMSDPHCRLLTLMGTAGVGKTRLALQAAQALQERFVDGVFFVSMVEVNDPTQIVATLMRALAIAQIDSRTDLTMLQNYLRPRQMLLLLDNFEQIVSGAPQLVDLLQAAPMLKLIITSRELLRVYGERVLAVPSLPLPNLSLPNLSLPDLAKADRPSSLPSATLVAEIVASPAVQLFIQHAHTVKPDFALTTQNQQSIAQLCIRLDGLPLAIELAAARTRLFSPQKIFEQLSPNVHRSGLLKNSVNEVPARQKTLKAAIDWSYQLLNEDERRLFRQLAVFAGGASIDEVYTVCLPVQELAQPRNSLVELPGDDRMGDDRMGDNEKVLSLLESLLDKSLVYYSDPALEEGEEVEPRVEMLVTIREFALQKLIEQQELRTLQARHAHAYLAVAQRFDPYPVSTANQRGSQQLQRLRRIHYEHANFQAALQWCFGDIQHLTVPDIPAQLHVSKTAHDPVLGIKLLEAISTTWFTRNYEQGCAWSIHAVRLIEADPWLVDRALQADTYSSAGHLHYFAKPINSPYNAADLLTQALAIFAELEDEPKSAIALTWLMHHHITQQNWAALATLRQRLEQLATHARSTGLVLLGRLAFIRGDNEQAYQWLKRAEEKSLAQDDQMAWSYAVSISGFVAMKEGTWQQVETKHHQALALTRRMRRKDIQMYLLGTLAEIALLRNQPIRALELSADALPIARDMGYDFGVAFLMLCAAAALATGNQSHLADDTLDDLIAVAHRLTNGVKPPDYHMSFAYPRGVGYATQAVGEARLANAQNAGSPLSVDQAIALVVKKQMKG